MSNKTLPEKNIFKRLSFFRVNTIEILISIAFGLFITPDEFILIKHVRKECDIMKEEIKNLKRLQQLIKNFNLFIKQC